MWTAENRGRYDRSKLRYPSDLTNEEWAYVEPLIPPGKGSMRRVNVREVMNGIMYILSTGCQGGRSPRISLRAAHFSTTSTCGATTARWIVSIMRSTLNAAKKVNGKPARPLPSSIAKA